jgi:hypothetical protein
MSRQLSAEAKAKQARKQKDAMTELPKAKIPTEILSAMIVGKSFLSYFKHFLVA